MADSTDGRETGIRFGINPHPAGTTPRDYFCPECMCQTRHSPAVVIVADCTIYTYRCPHCGRTR